MKGLMDAEGLPYGRRTHSYNSRLAQELGKWADTQPGGEAAPRRALPGLFRRGAQYRRSRTSWSRSPKSVGLPADEARAVLSASAGLRTQVDADWAKSRAYGVTGVPTFVAARYGVVGAQPYEVSGSSCSTRPGRCGAPEARRRHDRRWRAAGVRPALRGC